MEQLFHLSRGEAAVKPLVELLSVVARGDGALVLDGHRYEVKRRGTPVSLTPSEFKVLFTLASNPDRVMTRGELVEKALGYQFEGYERSVDAHVKNIRHKINDDPRDPSFILTVYGLGYKFIGKRDD